MSNIMDKKQISPPQKKYEVYEKLNEICSPMFGQLYHVDLLYITTYLFRICKIKDMLTRNDKRSKYSLFSHLDQHKVIIIPIILKKEAQDALLDSVYKERCLCRGQKPFPGGPKPTRNQTQPIQITQQNET